MTNCPKKIPANPQTNPMGTGSRTWAKECWRRIILQVPTMPLVKRARQIHQIGLKANNSPKQTSPPINTPAEVMCPLIFQNKVMTAQMIMASKEATKIPDMYPGTRKL